MPNMYNVLIGTYGPENEETIHWLKYDPTEQNFMKISAVTGIENPSFIIVNHKKTRLYAVSEVDEGEVVSYEIDSDHNILRELNRQPTKGGPCFLEIDEHDRFLFTANYGGGSIIVHPLNENGEIEPFTDFHEYGSRTDLVAHAHAIKHVPNSSLYVVTDLGLDALYVYEFDDQEGKLKLITELQTAKNAGPRHLTFHHDLNTMYVLNQNDSTALVYLYDVNKRTFKLVQVVPALLDRFDQTNYCADIHLSICKQYLYVSNRGHHSITSYKISTNGRLDPIANISSGGKWPRNFAVVPNNKHMIVANEYTNNLNVLNISQNGVLKDSGREFVVSNPVCVRFV